MESSFARFNYAFFFNFGVQSLEQSVELDRLVILISLTILLSKHHFFQTDNQKAVHFTVRQSMQFQENPGSRNIPSYEQTLELHVPYDISLSNNGSVYEALRGADDDDMYQPLTVT